ncbi:MAG TPA: HDOD domain-containing protein, partial [Treponemataceae bacterium]|nr:HDOD domain-containing protein [Treponemataceae bacterium]
GYYVKTIFHVKNDLIRIETRNNAALTRFEFKRIHDKIARAHQYKNINDAFSQVLDETEGAGLGIVIMILMLEKINVSDENFIVLSENGETIVRILLPLNKTTQDEIQTFSKELVTLVDSLPQLPDNIVSISKLLNDPKSKLSDIAKQISNDVALTADLLRIANSAAFSRVNPCTRIHEAITRIGTRGLQNMLLSIGAISSLGSSTKQQKALWKHSYQVAFYSFNIARMCCTSSQTNIQDSYVCGLLHDMGRVVFESAHPNLLDSFKKKCTKKALTPELFEKLAAGVNHAEIGAEIAKKWNFPDSIVNSIRYHHSPEKAPEEFKTLTSIIYLANMISHYQAGSVDFYQIDPKILKLITVSNEVELEALSAKLSLAFEQDDTVM